MLRALRNTGIIVIYQTPDLHVLWGQNVPPEWSDGDILGKTDADFLSAPMAERIMEMKREVLASGVPEKLEFHEGVEHGGRWYDMWIDADTGDDDEIAGLVTTMVEVTDRKRREQTLRTLLREVSHRSKNLLAVIQSIATQTGRYSGSMEVFLNRFRGRLQSLASSQDLVTSSNWRGARLSELVDSQAARYCDDPTYSIRLRGVDPQLSPNAALHIGLALHELIVNSMSHGALSRPNGYVDLDASLEEADDPPAPMKLSWLENSSKAQGAVTQKQFGSVALERVVPASLDGEAELSIGGGRVEYRLLMPAANFELG